jgi:hypothetical protein
LSLWARSMANDFAWIAATKPILRRSCEEMRAACWQANFVPIETDETGCVARC